MGFVFYDTETTGKSTAFDQILQFAAIKTDADLNELDRIEVRSRLQPDVVAHPKALQTNGISVARLTDPELPTHYEMVRAIRAKILEWSPAVFVGYNSLGFDEHLLRQAFFKTLHPPYVTNTEGNCRADAMTLVQAASVFAPECLKVPTDGAGKAVFKLDQMAPTNGFAHENAHDAIADVEATIHLARCVKQNAPECWDRFVRFAQKAAAADFVESEDGFVLTEFYFNKPYHYVVGYFGEDPEQSSVKLCLDLRVDQAWLKTLAPDALSTYVRKSPKPVRRVKVNSAPLIAGLDDMPDFVLHGLSRNEIAERAVRLRGDGQLCDALVKAFEDSKAEPEVSVHFEEQLYGQFVSDADWQKVEGFHVVSWPERLPIVESLDDPRLRHFGRMLIHQHSRESLSQEHCSEMDGLISSRLMDGAAPADKWTSIPVALQAVDEILSAGGAGGELLTEYRTYLVARAEAFSAG